MSKPTNSYLTDYCKLQIFYWIFTEWWALFYFLFSMESSPVGLPQKKRAKKKKRESRDQWLKFFSNQKKKKVKRMRTKMRKESVEHLALKCRCNTRKSPFVYDLFLRKWGIFTKTIFFFPCSVLIYWQQCFIAVHTCANGMYLIRRYSFSKLANDHMSFTIISHYLSLSLSLFLALVRLWLCLNATIWQ